MVHRPFSDNDGHTGFVQTKMFNRVHRPKISTILSNVDTSRGKSMHTKAIRNSLPNDLRMARNTVSVKDQIVQTFASNEYFLDEKIDNSTVNTKIVVEAHSLNIPKESKFFPPIEEQELQSIEQKNSKEMTVVFPEPLEPKDNSSAHLTGMFMANKNTSEKLHTLFTSQIFPPEVIEADSPEEDSNKADYLLHGNPVDIENLYSYNFNVSINPYVCEILHVVDADIDAQKKYADFDIEVKII